MLAELVRTSKSVARATARSEKTALIAALLRRLEAHDVGLAVAYLCGETPQGRLGIGYSTLASTDALPATEASLTLRTLDERLTELAACKGSGSARRRTELLGRLFSASTEDEQVFLRHLLVGELRQGALEGVVVEAVASAFEIEPDRLRRAAMLNGDLARVAQAVREGGAVALERFGLVLFRPLAPMLAQSAANVGEALENLGSALFEHKLDGARVQVHKDDTRVAVYTRSLHEVSARVPEVVELVRSLRARSVVLDGEVLGMRADGRPEPFQVTMRRFGRKDQTEELRREIPLSAFFFDVLHADGDDLVDRPLEARSGTLAAIVPEVSRVPQLATADGALAERFLADALALGREGVMAKATGAPYEAGRRGAAWLKVKPAHTLDLVVLAAEWGSGRRHGKLSNIHLGARDPTTESYVMLGKTFKGMTDAMLAWQTEEFLKLALGREGHVVHVRPELVVEVAFDGVQTSTQYPGGVALRFARVKRYRADKSASEADTIESVRRLLPAGGETKAPADWGLREREQEAELALRSSSSRGRRRRDQCLAKHLLGREGFGPRVLSVDFANGAACLYVSESHPRESKAHFFKRFRPRRVRDRRLTLPFAFLGPYALALLLAKVLHALATKRFFRPKLIVSATTNTKILRVASAALSTGHDMIELEECACLATAPL